MKQDDLCAIALYKGPPTNSIWHWLGHWLIRLRIWSKYSHAEVVIAGLCYSSSATDGGVRYKQIDLTSGKWDILPINLTLEQRNKVVDWFITHDGENYDWKNILHYVFPFISQKKNQYICFEAVGEALGLPNAYSVTANDLYDYAIKNSGN